NPRRREQYFPALCERPDGHQLGIVQFLECFQGDGSVLRECFQDFLLAAWLRLCDGADFVSVLGEDLSQTALTDSDMHGELAERRGSGVRLPGQFVAWNAIQNTLSDF